MGEKFTGVTDSKGGYAIQDPLSVTLRSFRSLESPSV